ncbi:hypothetical protein SDC9_04120 [bioreactor metagenome]|uniref:Uncharacterized protein n=1 Tax=bioreactor metagenome TaxID=1076179 RepID=A0A644SVA7_9ZZZZ|nr:hypothetical protein [Negativicutes bacterium]
MKIPVTKVGAARSQLIEAINLFFEERDQISIHTLVGASLQILNDHINSTDAKVNYLTLHYDNVFVKEEHRKFLYNKLNESKNFFKHADKDLKEGKLLIDFETGLNEFNIWEAIRCLSIVEGKNYVVSAEFKVFNAWFFLKYPELIKEEYRDLFKPLNIDNASFSFSDWREILRRNKLEENN